MSAAILHREAFEVSRSLDFCNKKQLTVESGHAPEDWPLVILKELLDNALDAAEEADVAPKIKVKVSTERQGGAGEMVIVDNGPGIPPKVVEGILDYTVRVSSHEADVSPTRGAQGNAVKTLVAMPYALDGKQGVTVIAAQGVAHIITFRVDHLRQEPVLDHDSVPLSTKGTWISLEWPNSAMDSEQFIEFIKRELEEHGVEKVIPAGDVLKGHARRMIEKSLMEKEFAKVENAIKQRAADIELPDDLQQLVEQELDDDPALPCDAAVANVVWRLDEEGSHTETEEGAP